MKLFLGPLATLAILSTPLAAQAQLFGSFDNNTVLGGAAGAEAIDGLAGYTIANRRAQSPRYGSAPTSPAYGQNYGGHGYGPAYQTQYPPTYQPQYQPRVVYTPAPQPYAIAQPNVYLGQSYYHYNHATPVPAQTGWSSLQTYYVPPATLGCSGNVCRRPVRR